MRLFTPRGLPPRISQEEKLLVFRYLGAGIWLGVFVSMTALLALAPRFGEAPGLLFRVLVSVGGLSLIEIIIGYLLYTGVLL